MSDTADAGGVPPHRFFARLAAEMRSLERHGLGIEDWITLMLARDGGDVSTPSAALQDVDRQVQVMRELALLFDRLAGGRSWPLPEELDRALEGVRVKHLARALRGLDGADPPSESGCVDLF